MLARHQLHKQLSGGADALAVLCGRIDAAQLRRTHMRAYYLTRAAALRIPQESGLLYATLAVAHCHGECTNADAVSVCAAALPHSAASGSSPVPFAVEAIDICCGAVGQDESLGCACRAQLAATLASSMPWHSQLLSPMQRPVSSADNGHAHRGAEVSMLASERRSGNQNAWLVAARLRADGQPAHCSLTDTMIRLELANGGLVLRLQLQHRHASAAARVCAGFLRASSAALAHLTAAAAVYGVADGIEADTALQDAQWTCSPWASVEFAQPNQTLTWLVNTDLTQSVGYGRQHMPLSSRLGRLATRQEQAAKDSESHGSADTEYIVFAACLM